MTLATLSIALALIVFISTSQAAHQQDQAAEQPDTDNNSYERRHCDLDECDALVTKCRQTKKCICDFKKDINCAKRCINCLEEKFAKCCACVGLCSSAAAAKEQDASHVGRINTTDEYTAYFNVLTNEDDEFGRWTVVKHDGVTIHHPEHGPLNVAYRNSDNDQVISYNPELEKMNCTVAFINRSLSMTKCKKACTHMGASFYRWFFNGCCECTGKYCLNYGIDEPQCKINDY